MSTIRLRYLVKIGPKPQVGYLRLEDSEVTFAPMDALADGLGGLDTSLTRRISEVASASYNFFADGDLLLAKVTPCFENGKKALARGLTNGIGFATSEVHVIRPDTRRIHPKYLLYVLSSEDFRSAGMASMTGAGGLRRVSEEAVLNYRPHVTDLTTQKAIADFLDRETARIDQLIERKQRLVAALGERDGVLVEEQLNGVDVSHIHRLKFVIRRIQQGWSPQCEDAPVEGEKWGVLKLGAITTGVYLERHHKALPQNIEPVPSLRVQVGDVLVARASGSPKLVGKAAFVESANLNLMLSDKHFRLVPDPKKVLPEYLALVVNSNKSRTQIEDRLSSSEGMARNIGQNVIYGLRCPFPPLEIQREILSAVHSSRMNTKAIILKTNASTDRLREFRSALITAAVTGQIDVVAWSKRGQAGRQLHAIQQETMS